MSPSSNQLHSRLQPFSNFFSLIPDLTFGIINSDLKLNLRRPCALVLAKRQLVKYQTKFSMTSISQPALSPQASNTSSQTVTQAHIPSGPTSGKATPQTGATASATARSSYASVSKKPISPTSALNASSSPAAAGGSTSQHGKADSVNGKGVIPPAVPVVGTPTIVNGNTVMSPTAGSSDHSRKPSVTISAAGASGYMLNGGPVGGKPTGGNSIQFGSVPPSSQSTNSLAVHTPSNPRITSPQTTPSPIPQPAASGGRPPSSLQGQGNGMNFRADGEEVSVSQCLESTIWLLTPNSGR